MLDDQDLIIRLANEADLPELARLRWDFSMPELQAAMPRADFAPEFAAFYHSALASGEWQVIVAADGAGGLHGNVYLQRIHKIPRPARLQVCYGYLTNMYVEPELRGRGIGTRMIQKLLEDARAAGLELVILWPAAPSITFYERNGFQRSGETMILHLH